MGSYEQTMLKLEKMAQQNTATQMNWQEKMSKTSHQMEVADLVKAGLNPVLSSGGSGAQGYTTSVDSAVNGIAGMASARESASATRYAARQSAAATRAAAAAQLEAARLAASASNYSADQHLSGIKYQTDNNKSGSFAGILSNLFKNATLKLSNADYKATMKNVNLMSGNPSKWLRYSDQKVSAANLNKAAKLRCTAEMNRYGIKNTFANRDIFAKAFIGGNRTAMTKWSALISAAAKKRNSAWSNRSYSAGSGVF